MKRFEEIDFNVEQVKKKDFEYFRSNVKDMVARGVIGYKENGKVVAPTEAQIKARFEELTGTKVTKEVTNG
jgi:hypothetical protein